MKSEFGVTNKLIELRDKKQIYNFEVHWNLYFFEYKNRKYIYNNDLNFLQWKENGESLALEKIDILDVIKNIENEDWIYRNYVFKIFRSSINGEKNGK